MNGNMSRDKNYQHLLNSKRWKQLRQWKLEQNPLCELCSREDKVVSAIDVHHITPVESARTPDEMEQLCFNPNNLQALCISCHAKVHREARSHTRRSHEQRERDRLERWKEELERRVANINQSVVMDER
jgi:5-methylcytosine-specific restriction protein A